jgi:multiple sugar transport system permease protein
VENAKEMGSVRNMIKGIANIKNREAYFGRMFITILLLFLGIICLMPLAWMISTSFKPELDVFEFPIHWIPKRWTFDTYNRVFSDDSFLLYFYNSSKVTFFIVIGNVFFSAIAAYAFARLRFKGKNVIFIMYLATMMIPNQVLLVPKYLLFQFLSIDNTHLTLILPQIFEVFSVFLLRQTFMSIPMDFSEAATIDGAGQFRTFRQIILPMAKPTLMTVALLQFTNSWNDFINAKTYLNIDVMFTLPIGLQKFQLSNSSNYSTIMAGTAVSLIPIIIMFIITQKYFVESFASSAIKG